VGSFVRSGAFRRSAPSAQRLKPPLQTFADIFSAGTAGFLAGIFLVAALSAGAADLNRVSVDSSGSEADGLSMCRPAVSADGRFVAFSSAADNLVPGDTNGVDDVFVHDQLTGATTRVSLTHTGAEANGWCRNPAISADGRFVAYVSVADNLVPADTNNAWDVFVYDRQDDTVERVTLAHDGGEAQHGFLWHEFTLRNVPMTDDPQRYPPAISADGRFVVFVTDAPNLVPGDTNGRFDVFVRDRQNATIERVSVATGGTEADGGSHHATISADGRFVVFNSAATNLVADDTNDRWDTFVHDRDSGVTERVSLAADGAQANGESVDIPAVSTGGRYVAFTSHATNLVAGDTNGQPDVFLRDRQAGTTVRVSLRANGSQANGAAFQPSISADGRFVVFASTALNTVPGIAAGSANIFLADRVAGGVACISRTAKLKPSHGRSQLPVVSADGGVIAFAAEATDLVADDTNGVSDIFTNGSSSTDLTLTLQAAPVLGGSVTPSTPVSVAPWTALDIAATAAVGYEFTGWSVLSGNATLGDAAATTTTVTLNADSTLVANFAALSYPVTFATAPSPANSSLTGDTTQTVTYGTASEPVTANAPEGYRFVKWTRDGLDYSVANPIAVADVTAPLDLVANFAPEHLVFHQVTFAAGDHGEVVGETVQVVANGANGKTVAAVPAAGFQFVKWTRNGADASIEASLTVTDVVADLAFVANFAPDDEVFHTVELAAGPNGALDGELFQVVRHGEPCAPVAALPDANYGFANWTRSGVAFAVANPLAVNVTTNLLLVANFAPANDEQYTVTFLVDGPGTLVGETVQVVRHGEATTPVTAVPDDACLFRGWTGDFTGKVNPLTLLRVRRDLTVTARFIDPALLEPLARGARFEIHADDVGLSVFTKKPKVAGYHYLPYGPDLQRRQKKAAAKILDKIPDDGAASLAAEWTKTIRLYDADAFKRAQRNGVTAAEWLGYADTQTLLDLDLWLKSPEASPTEQFLRPAVLMPPDITEAPVVADGIITLVGSWFGTKTPKAWLEAVAADGAIVRIKLKLLPPADPALLDAYGRPAFMNAADGTSKLTAPLPVKYPRGITSANVGAVVLDNGAGLATHRLDLAE
jgi:Tol biopolymer transport system component